MNLDLVLGVSAVPASRFQKLSWLHHRTGLVDSIGPCEGLKAESSSVIV